jgi:Ca2+-binding RTX toxin-like protein
MAVFTGTNADEFITPDTVSASVTPNNVKPGPGADTINAGGGNDTVAGGGGNDVVDLGDGDDLFLWMPGDGADTVAGGSGTDTIAYTALVGTDTLEVSRSGGSAVITDLSPPVTLTGVEIIKLFALTGQDAVFVHDVSGTDVRKVAIDLGATAGGAADGEQDHVYVAGTSGKDKLKLLADGGDVTVKGLAYDITVTGIDGKLDMLRIDVGAGDDRIKAGDMGKNGPILQFEGGDGNDKLVGGKGGDLLSGGRGRDVIKGGKGDDELSGGEGRDTLDGGKGSDTFVFTEWTMASGRDKIVDFKPGVDIIAIAPEWARQSAMLARDEFRLGTTAKDADDRVLYDKSTGVLRWDADGKGGQDAIAFAKVAKGLDLSHKDFAFLIE